MSLKSLATLVLAVVAAVWFCTTSFLSADRALHAQTRLSGDECCSGAGGAECCGAAGVVMVEPARDVRAPGEVAPRPVRSALTSRRRESASRGSWTVPVRPTTTEARDS
jgi:hypothetical protein